MGPANRHSQRGSCDSVDWGTHREVTRGRGTGSGVLVVVLIFEGSVGILRNLGEIELLGVCGKTSSVYEQSGTPSDELTILEPLQTDDSQRKCRGTTREEELTFRH